jgi:hypothetical protein
MKNTDVFYDNQRYFASNTIPHKISPTLDELPAKRQKTSVDDLSYEFQPEPISASSPLIKTEKSPLVPLEKDVKDVVLNGSIVTNSSLNSSDVGDVTLEKMIDAILASAKHGRKFRKQQKIAISNRNKILNNNNTTTNLNTIRRNDKNLKSSKLPNLDMLIGPEEIERATDRTIIIDDKMDQVNEREVKSPIQTEFEVVDDKTADVCQLKRQKAVRRKNTSNENKNKKNEDLKDKENENSSTHKCLTFSPTNDQELSDKFKRSSVSSISSTCSASSLNKYTKNVLMKGSLELSVSADDSKKKITIHGECVVKC